MSNHGEMRSRMLPVGLALAALLGSTAPMDVRADAVQDRRAEMGARIFRRVLLGEVDPAARTGSTSAARIAVLHVNDAARAKKLADSIAQKNALGTPEPLRGLPARVDVVALGGASGLSSLEAGVAGLFVAQPLARPEFDRVRATCAEKRILCFSPFEGDVERGLATGLWIGSQVLVHVNAPAAEASGVRFSERFLEIGKVLR